jgi:large subunit ribosomal protein L13
MDCPIDNKHSTPLLRGIETNFTQGVNTMRTTYMAKPQDVDQKWYVVDAAGKTLGRLATEVATLLRGKHKPTYTPHIDTGDFVIVINSSQINLTGKKLEQKRYYRHSGFPGGLKSITAGDLRASRPERMIELAVKGMLPKGPLGRSQLKKLKVYAGSEHPHQAQQPVEYQLRG